MMFFVYNDATAFLWTFAPNLSKTILPSTHVPTGSKSSSYTTPVLFRL